MGEGPLHGMKPGSAFGAGETSDLKRGLDDILAAAVSRSNSFKRASLAVRRIYWGEGARQGRKVLGTTLGFASDLNGSLPQIVAS